MRGGGRIAFLGRAVEIPGLVFVRADKDGDGDFDPLTSTSWDGDAFGEETGTINWNTVFGVPTAAKAVSIHCVVKDETIDVRLEFKAKATTTSVSLAVRTQVANLFHDVDGIVAIQSDGTSYYHISGELDAVYLRVVGWYI